MAGFGFGVNRFIAAHQSSIGLIAATKPTQVKPKFTLPGTIYVVQQGAIYALKDGSFTQLTGEDGWLQPTLMPDGSGIIAVKEVELYYSDLYLLGLNGDVEKQLSHNSVPIPKDGDLSGEHWMFYPKVGPNGKLYFSYDQPKAGYQVDLAVWDSPIDGIGTDAMQRYTQPNYYTGGDVSPIPLPGGALLYVKFSVNGQAQAYSEFYYKANGNVPDYDGTSETTEAENCSEPSLSSLGELAFICSSSSTNADLVIAKLNSNGSLGPMRTLVVNGLCASPTWSPDGKSLLYFAPSTNGTGYFQLWWLSGANSSSPSAPRELTEDDDLDATSAPVWSAS